MAFKSIRALGAVLKKVPVERRKLRKYTWLPDVFRLDGSIVGRIIGPVLTVTTWAVIVAVAKEVYGYHINLSNNVLPLLSVVVGLILVFRNSTSYDRYYEARKDFGVMTSSIRNLSRLIWVNVYIPTRSDKEQKPTASGLSALLAVTGTVSPRHIEEPSSGGQRPTEVEQLTADKIRIIKLLLSFAFATMHHLRNEPGTDYDDFEGVLPPGFKYNATELGIDKNTLLNRYATYSAIDKGHVTRLPKHLRHPSFKSTISVEQPNLETPLLQGDHTTVEFRPRSSPSSLPLPLIIAHELTRVMGKFRRAGYVDPLGPAGFNGMTTLVSGLVDQFTNMERIATTPIPISYGIHLKQCVTLYLFSLPFTLISDMHWRMVPLVTVVAFTLMGIEGIANDIEMPFGKGAADLPLERYCDALKSEVEYIIERLPEGTEPDVDPFEDYPPASSSPLVMNLDDE